METMNCVTSVDSSLCSPSGRQNSLVQCFKRWECLHSRQRHDHFKGMQGVSRTYCPELLQYAAGEHQGSPAV